MCMQVSTLCISLVPTGAQRGHQIPSNWTYKWLRGTKWVLGIKTGSSAKIASDLNY